jgi:hypothetical protein
MLVAAISLPVLLQVELEAQRVVLVNVVVVRAIAVAKIHLAAKLGLGIDRSKMVGLCHIFSSAHRWHHPIG